MYRLTTGDVSASPTPVAFGLNTDPTKWGKLQEPTEVIDTFVLDGTTPVTKEAGPIIGAPTVTLDDANKVWVFFGTGRYYSASDKTDTSTQYFFGIKDSVLSYDCAQSSATNCQDNDLVNVSGASICTTCAANGNVTGVTATVGAGSVTVTDFDNSSANTSLVQLVKTKDGWVTTMPDSRERVLAAPALLGGVVFFPSFTPVNDICTGIGTSQLYGLFYKTGTAHKDPILGVTTSAGNNYANRRVSMGEGMMSQAAIHIGAQGSGSSGTSSGTGCQGRVSVIMQSSMGALSGRCTTPVSPVYSRYISWVNNRD
jgi:type IV pilus assembly protein PilY1